MRAVVAPQIQKVRGNSEQSSQSLTQLVQECGCVTPGLVGISWENKRRLITDRAHIPPWAVLRDKADHRFSHTAMAISVGERVRPAEALGWRRFTELLCFDMYLMSRPGYVSRERLGERRK